jgi:glycosyltransferase involved in cell wall biosynthesis
VVALRRGSVEEVVADGVSGYVRDRLEELPAAIRRTGELDPAACRDHVAGRFDVRTMADGYERIYRELAASGDS